MDSWDFDLFELVELSQGTLSSLFHCSIFKSIIHFDDIGRPLYFMGIAVCEKYNFKEDYNLDDDLIRKFFQVIEAGYKVFFSSCIEKLHPNLIIQF